MSYNVEMTSDISKGFTDAAELSPVVMEKEEVLVERSSILTGFDGGKRG